MRRHNAYALKIVAAALAMCVLPACTTLRSIEPVIAPPTQFQLDRVVAVEFLDASKVGQRCAERGATFFGLPGFNSGACGNRDLITMPNPCDTNIGGYAAALCAYVEQRQSRDTQPHLFNAGLNKLSSKAKSHISDLRALRAAATWPAPPASQRKSDLTIEFVHPDLALASCISRGLEVYDVSPSGPITCGNNNVLLAANPCLSNDQSWYAATACHELAHANGWAADHHDGSYFAQKSFVKPKLSQDDILPAEMVLTALQAKSATRQNANTIGEPPVVKAQPAYVAESAVRRAWNVATTFFRTLPQAIAMPTLTLAAF